MTTRPRDTDLAETARQFGAWLSEQLDGTPPAPPPAPAPAGPRTPLPDRSQGAHEPAGARATPATPAAQLGAALERALTPMHQRHWGPGPGWRPVQ